MKSIPPKLILFLIILFSGLLVIVSLNLISNSKLLNSKAYLIYLSCKSEKTDLSQCIVNRLIASSTTASADLLTQFWKLSGSGFLTEDPRIFIPIAQQVGASYIKRGTSINDSISLCPNVFDYSCLEGVFTGYFETTSQPPYSRDSILSTCNSYLETSFANKKAFAICTRSMGKEIYTRTYGTVEQLVTGCDVLSVSYAQQCMQGIYEMYSTGIGAGSGYINDAKVGSIRLSCKTATKNYIKACNISYASSELYSPSKLKSNFNDVFEYCGSLTDANADNCFYGYAQKAYLVTGGKFFKTLDYCHGSSVCVGQVVSVYAEGFDF